MVCRNVAGTGRVRRSQRLDRGPARKGGQRRTRSRLPLRKGDVQTDAGRSASQGGQGACSAAVPRLLAATPPAALAQQSWPTPAQGRGVVRPWVTSWMQRRTRTRMGRKVHCVGPHAKALARQHASRAMWEGPHLLAILSLLIRSCIASSGSCTKVRRLLLQRAGCGEYDYA